MPNEMKMLFENFRKYTQKVINESVIMDFLNEYNLVEEWKKHSIINEADLNLWKATRDDVAAMVKTGKHLKDGKGGKWYKPEKVNAYVSGLGAGDLEKGIDVLWTKVQHLQTKKPPANAPVRGDMPVIPPEKGAMAIAKKLLNKGHIDVFPPYAGGEKGAGETEAAGKGIHTVGRQKKEAEFGEKGYTGDEESAAAKLRADWPDLSPEERKERLAQVKKEKPELAAKSGLEEQNVDLQQFPNVGGPMDKAAGQRFLNKGTKDGKPKEDAVKVRNKNNLDALKLLPSQSQIWLGKAIVMASGGVNGGDLGAIVSSDGHILDGHHRWAATMLAAKPAPIQGVEADLPIGQLIPVLRTVGDAMGFPRRP